MFCQCGGSAKKYGRYREDASAQRWRCHECGRTFTQDRLEPGNNFVPGAKRAELKRLLVAGVPVRAAARTIGVAHNTAQRYYRLWKVDAKCPCGQASNHMGWCRWRVLMCPDRNSWLDQQWQRRNTTPIGDLIKEGTVKARAKGHDIGTWVWGAEANAGLWPWTKCRTCGAGLSMSAVFSDPHVTGRALVVACETPAERQQKREEGRAIKQQRLKAKEEKKSWREGKRTLKQLQKILRAPSNSQSVASTLEPTSHR